MARSLYLTPRTHHDVVTTVIGQAVTSAIFPFVLRDITLWLSDGPTLDHWGQTLTIEVKSLPHFKLVLDTADLSTLEVEDIYDKVKEITLAHLETLRQPVPANIILGEN